MWTRVQNDRKIKEQKLQEMQAQVRQSRRGSRWHQHCAPANNMAVLVWASGPVERPTN